MLFRMRWVRRSIRQKLLGIITILEHSGPEVGFGEIAIDLPQARFRFADQPGVGPTLVCVSAACQSRAGRLHSRLLRAVKRS
jgi:hypothetical protein